MRSGPQRPPKGSAPGSAQERLEAELQRRGISRGDTSIYGQTVRRTIEPGHEPQRLMDATALQRNLVACAYATPSPGENRCAAWVEVVFGRLGICMVGGDALELYQSYCPLTDTADLKVGMIVAVPAHPFSLGARGFGHVGLYIGDGKLMDSVAGEVRTVPLELWLTAYGVMAEPRWGWLGSIGLA